MTNMFPTILVQDYKISSYHDLAMLYEEYHIKLNLLEDIELVDFLKKSKNDTLRKTKKSHMESL